MLWVGALYQIQNRKPKLIAYANKRLSEAARNYSITELEMCGLTINVASFVHLLKRVDFYAKIHHLALTHIIKSKAELIIPISFNMQNILKSRYYNIGKEKEGKYLVQTR